MASFPAPQRCQRLSIISTTASSRPDEVRTCSPTSMSSPSGASSHPLLGRRPFIDAAGSRDQLQLLIQTQSSGVSSCCCARVTRRLAATVCCSGSAPGLQSTAGGGGQAGAAADTSSSPSDAAEDSGDAKHLTTPCLGPAVLVFAIQSCRAKVAARRVGHLVAPTGLCRRLPAAVFRFSVFAVDHWWSLENDSGTIPGQVRLYGTSQRTLERQCVLNTAQS